MKAIILAAGYATRLYPLTKDKPKALLPIGGKPIIDYIMSELETIPIEETILVSNDTFYTQFLEWGKNKDVIILNDGASELENRLGAIGDINFVIDSLGIDDDVIVIASDNFFTYKLLDYYNFYLAKGTDTVCAKKISDIDKLKNFAVATLDDNDKIIDLMEKPETPRSNIAVFATYIYKKETIPLFKKYIEEGNNKDAPGYFVEWVYKQKDVHAYQMDGDCYDIGTVEMYEQINRRYN